VREKKPEIGTKRPDYNCPKCALLIVGDCGEHDLADDDWQEGSAKLPGELDSIQAVKGKKVRRLVFPQGSGYNIMDQPPGFVTIMLRAPLEEKVLAVQIDLNTFRAIMAQGTTMLESYRFRSRKPEPPKPS
jgi:hypothetical protein